MSKAGTDVDAKPFGIWRLIGAAFGGIIGSGWLIGGFSAAQIAGPKAVFSWIVGGGVVLIIALVMVDVGALMPKSGGIVWWPFHSSGRLVGTVVAAGVWIFYAANPPSEAIAMVRFIGFKPVSGLLHQDDGLTFRGDMLALAFMLVFVALNLFGVAWFARVNTAVTVSKFVVPVVTVVLLALAFKTRNFAASAGGHPDPGWIPALTAIVGGGVIYAYGGFQAPLDHAGDARRPQDIRRAVLISVVLSIVVYTSLQVVFIGAISHWTLHGGWNYISFVSRSPYIGLAVQLNYGWLSWMIIADSITSPTGSSVVFVSAMAQEVAQFGLNRIVPRWFADRSGRQQVLVKAMAIDLAIGCVLLTTGSWAKIAALSGAVSLFVYAMAAIPSTAFRHQAGLPRRWPGKALAPGSFALATVVLYGAGWIILSETVGLMLGLAVLLYGFRWRVPDPRRRDDLRVGVWLLAYFAALMLLSGLSSLKGLPALRKVPGLSPRPASHSLGGLNAIPVYAGIPAAMVLGVLAYAWGVRAAKAYLGRYPVVLPATERVPSPRLPPPGDTGAGVTEPLAESLPPRPEAPPPSVW